MSSMDEVECLATPYHEKLEKVDVLALIGNSVSANAIQAKSSF